jgi:ATP-dependent dihydroxyacetone kinase
LSQFINSKETLVTEAIDGVLCTAGGRLARLDGFPFIKVIVREDWDKSKVALISGGGSGHEPAHAGFVGAGMLTAAVCGDVFASPSVDAVLAGILAVSGPAGCLLIVKNYTGDRLNFGLAAERARAYGIKVSMVIVDDDIALPDLPQSRGIAGTLFIHKVAGALAENDANLEAVTEAAQRIIDNVASIGMSLDTCTVPGSPKEARIKEGKAELGLGIHGEPGVELIDFTTAHDAMAIVLERLKPHVGDGTKVALLNNLGGVTPLEMSVLAELLAKSDVINGIQYMIGPAALMTSLDMRGFSVSILPVSSEELALLQVPVTLRDWPNCNQIGAAQVLPLPDGLSPIKPIPSEDASMAGFVTHCCDVFIEAETELNALDVHSGDGDTGATLAGAARALKKSIDRLPLADLTQLYRAIGLELSQTMGGSSGVLLAIFFSAVGDALSSGTPNVKALKAGITRVQEVGGASPGDRTMIDALSPALDALPQGFSAAARAARQGADLTSKIVKAKAGRASYISEDRLRGHNDPGAEAVALLFEKMSAVSQK